MARAGAAALALVVGLILSGCEEYGGVTAEPEASPADGDVQVARVDLDGSTFHSTEVVGQELVPGTSVTLEFEGDLMSASAGCTTQFGSYEIDDEGLLRWTDTPATTTVACGADLAEQDAWLAELLTAGARVATDERGVTLTTDDATLALVSDAGPDLGALLGTRWSLVGTLGVGTLDPLPDGRHHPGLTVGTHGIARVDTGCNTGRTRVRVEGDTLELGPTALTRSGCDPPWRQVERRMTAVLDGTADTVLSEGSVLVVTRGDRGLVFSVG